MRHPTRRAIVTLAKRLSLPFEAGMQDWEIEVADSDRFDDFLQSYVSDDLSTDEKFLLMSILVQCVEDLAHQSDAEAMSELHAWLQVKFLLEADLHLHASTIHYWACLDELCDDNKFLISTEMRQLWKQITRTGTIKITDHDDWDEDRHNPAGLDEDDE